MKRLEHSLQIAVADMLQFVLDPERTWWSAIDHGVGKLGVVEASQRKKRGVKPGIPDFIIMAYGVWPPLIGIELKAGKGELTETQLDVADAWGSVAGFPIFLARSLEDAQAVLIHCRFPMARRLKFFTEGVIHECARRSATARDRSKGRRGKSKSRLPVVLARAPQT